MTVDELKYYRVTCDYGPCKTYINVAARDQEDLQAVLAKNKWAKPSHLSDRAYCPKHAEEGW